MNGKTLEDLELEVETEKALDDIMQDAEAQRRIAKLRRAFEEAGAMMGFADAGSKPVAIEVLPDDEAEDNEDEHAERL